MCLATKMQTGLMNNGTLVRLMDGIRKVSPKRWRWCYRECECGENNHWASHRGRLHCPLVAAVPPTLFTITIRRACLVGRNGGLQICDFVDPSSLVIKCIWGGGARVAGDLEVPMINKRPGGQVNTHTHTHTHPFK
jgi:hypothetical protein